MKEKIQKIKEFIADKPFVKKILITVLIFLAIKLLYSNLAWDSLRAKIPAVNRMFYSNYLSVRYWVHKARTPAGEEDLQIQDGVLKVKTLKIEKKPMTPSIKSSGVIEPFEKVEVYSKVSGRIEKFFVTEGQKVKRRQKLLKIESLSLEIELGKQKAALESARARYNLAREKYNLARKNMEIKLNEVDKKIASYEKSKAELKRVNDLYGKKRKLFRQGAIAREELEAIKLELKSKDSAYKIAKRDFNISMVGIRNEDLIRAGKQIPRSKQAKIELLKDINTKIERSEMNVAAKEVEQHQATVKATQIMIRESTLYSPINGIVSKKHKSRGVLINSGGMNNQSILTLVEINKVYASFFVNEFDSALIHQDMAVEIKSDIFNDKVFKGKVKIVSPEIDKKTHTSEIKVVLENHNHRLKPGMFIRANVLTGKQVLAILLPEKVIRPVENNLAEVYILKPNKEVGSFSVFKKRITMGKKHDDAIEIRDGLKPGDVIATSHLSRLREGMKVKPFIQ